MAEVKPSYEEIEQRLHQTEEALQKAARLMIAGQYAGAVMHEVNNPLEAVTNLVYLAKVYAHDANRVCANMELAEAQLERLGDIARRTLSFYRQEAEARDLDLVQIAEAALRIHEHRLAAKSIEVRKHMPEPVVARVHAGEILQVFSNFILNAIEALPEERATLCVRIKVRGANAHITIADNGHGIHPSIRKTLFQPYVTMGKSKGTGFGLWASKLIIDKHKGTISCRSSRRPGNSGTTFRLSLPLQLGTLA